jgi:RNA polymerase sigma-70 factor, ECF subfamily
VTARPEIQADPGRPANRSRAEAAGAVQAPGGGISTEHQDPAQGGGFLPDPRRPADARERAAAPPADADLLRMHIEGDSEAFGQLFRRHKDRLWAVAIRTLGDPEEAADALQDAMISAFRRASSFRGDSAVTTWLHRIVVNACLDRMRRRSARPTAGGGDEELLDSLAASRTPVSDPSGATDVQLDVMAALRQLVPDQQAALVLVDMLGYSVADAAEVLGVSEGTVKSRCARGRARLLPRLAHLSPAARSDSQDRNQSSGARVLPAQEGGDDAR